LTPDLERTRLAGRRPRSVPPSSDSLIVPVGVALVLAGVGLVLFLAGVIPRIGSPSVAPVLVLPFAGLSFVLGWLLLASSLARSLRRRRARRMARLRPAEPWLADRVWDPCGERDDTPRRALRSLGGGLLVGLFLVPFNWLVFGSEGDLPERIFFGLVTVFFDLFAVLLLAQGASLLVRLAGQGESHLGFERFPFLLGEPLAARFRAARGGDPRGPLRATLRCVEETYASDGPESASTECWQVYADVRDLAPASRMPSRGAWAGRIEFPLPDLPLGTRLFASTPRYWELEVSSPEAGAGEAATFLVPVYERPR